jgi:hypothetical protein
MKRPISDLRRRLKRHWHFVRVFNKTIRLFWEENRDAFVTDFYKDTPFQEYLRKWNEGVKP